MKKLYLLGHPVSHSLSPVMQNAALEHLGLDWEYKAKPVLPDNLNATLEELERDEDVIGCNVTVPHKVAVFDWLQKSGRGIDPLGQSASAINTLLKPRFGNAFAGTSTDALGAFTALAGGGVPVAEGSLQGWDVAIIGTGGSALSLAREIAFWDAAPLSLTIFGRSLEKALGIDQQVLGIERLSKKTLMPYPPLMHSAAELSTFPAWSQSHRTNCIIIQTTTVGMDTGEAPGLSPVPAGSVSEGQIAFDLVYKPHDTPFLIDAKANGATIVHGINMLVGQGALALEEWVNASADPKVREIFDRTEIMSVMRKALGIQ